MLSCTRIPLSRMSCAAACSTAIPALVSYSIKDLVHPQVSGLRYSVNTTYFLARNSGIGDVLDMNTIRRQKRNRRGSIFDGYGLHSASASLQRSVLCCQHLQQSELHTIVSPLPTICRPLGRDCTVPAMTQLHFHGCTCVAYSVLPYAHMLVSSASGLNYQAKYRSLVAVDASLIC